MIRLATNNDIKRILDITRACTLAMDVEGVFQWNSHYPSEEVFLKDVSIGALYVFQIKNDICGCIMFSDEKDVPYDSVRWLTPDNHNLYIHRLAVHPNFQKQGIARSLMDFAEAFAIKHQYYSVRLDTFSQNPRNIRFYEARNYKQVGDVYFPKQSTFPFHCYEKVFDPQ
jgi:ribosomal protein S18 acetylase RimI-like enzyme